MDFVCDHDWLIFTSNCVSCQGQFDWVGWDQLPADHMSSKKAAETVPFCEWETQPFWLGPWGSAPDRCPYCAASGYAFAVPVSDTFRR